MLLQAESPQDEPEGIRHTFPLPKFGLRQTKHLAQDVSQAKKRFVTPLGTPAIEHRPSKLGASIVPVSAAGQAGNFWQHSWLF